MTGLTVAEVLDLPAAVPLVVAGRALGIGRTTVHELAQSGRFPLPLIKVGARFRVRRSDLLELLKIDGHQEGNDNV